MPRAASAWVISSSISSGIVEARRGAASARSRPSAMPLDGVPRFLRVGGQVLGRVVEDQYLIDVRIRAGGLDDLARALIFAHMSGV